MKMVTYTYNDIQVMFTSDAWINATLVATHFNRRLDSYMENLDTKEYMGIVCRYFGFVDIKEILITKQGRNGGTWMHPELAVHFGRWLDKEFAFWCDRTIRQILAMPRQVDDWKRARHASASTYIAMSEILHDVREEDGKETKSYHYSNEARLINWVVIGKYTSLDRDALPMEELDLLAKLELLNIRLLATGRSYEERKLRLENFAIDWRMTHAQPLLINALQSS